MTECLGGKLVGREQREAGNSQPDQRAKLGSLSPDSLVWASGHVLGHHHGEDHEAHGGRLSGMLPWACDNGTPGQSHTWRVGVGTSSLVIIRGSGSCHLPTFSLSFRNGGERRWAGGFRAGSWVHWGPFRPSVSTCSSRPVLTVGEVSS